MTSEESAWKTASGDTEHVGLVKKNAFKTNVESLPIWRLFAITAAMAGIQFSYTVEFTFVTPKLQELGVGHEWTPVIWLAGPLSGFIVQPIVGVYSDRLTSRFGRRRPFIAFGALMTILGMILLASAIDLGKAIIGPEGYAPLSLTLFIGGLWLMNFSINCMQGPARALIADVVPPAQQQLANGICTAMMGFANFVGNITGSFDLVAVMPFFGSNFTAIFSIGLVFLFCGVVPTILLSPEVQFTPATTDSSGGAVAKQPNFFVKLFRTVRYMPKEMFKIAIVYFFSWFGYFPFMIFITDFFGRNVYGGDPNAKGSFLETDYALGVRKAAMALAFQSVVLTLFSFVLDRVVKVVGLKPVFFVAQIIAGTVFILFVWVQVEIPVMILISLVAFNFAAFNSVPFALLKSAVNEEDNGVYMGVLNAFAVIAQTISNFLAGSLIIPLFSNVAAGLAMGGVFSVLGAFLIFIVNPSKQENKDNDSIVDESASLNKG